jgi:hypothetical protein
MTMLRLWSFISVIYDGTCRNAPFRAAPRLGESVAGVRP